MELTAGSKKKYIEKFLTNFMPGETESFVWFVVVVVGGGGGGDF